MTASGRKQTVLVACQRALMVGQPVRSELRVDRVDRVDCVGSLVTTSLDTADEHLAKRVDRVV
jgi:hypothetical protein